MFIPQNISHVTCHVSRVLCGMSGFFFEKLLNLIGGGSVQGLPRLVYKGNDNTKLFSPQNI